MKEVLRTVPLKPAELKQLKVLAEQSRAAQGIQSPLTLVLCPSVLARAAQEKSTKANRKVVAVNLDQCVRQALTPLAGLVMQTRVGSVDPGLLLWLLENANVDSVTLGHILDSQSGLKGLSGTSGDLRDVLA